MTYWEGYKVGYLEKQREGSHLDRHLLACYEDEAYRRQHRPACGLCRRASEGEYQCQRCGVWMCFECVGYHTITIERKEVCAPHNQEGVT